MGKWSVFALALVFACGSEESPDSTGGTGPTGATASTASFGGTASGVPAGCADDARLVDLVSNDAQLLRFDPASLAVSSLGKLSCSVDGGPAVGTPTPVSMAVSRGGIAFVLYDDGTMHLVDVATGECNRAPFERRQMQGFDTFGMGFVSNASGTSAETLYVAAHDGSGLGIVDQKTFRLEPVGAYSGGLDGPAELTGTGDARLFGLFLMAPARVVELDKITAKTKSEARLDVRIGDAWAFAFWGGDFWLFTSDNRPTSEVHRYRPATGQLDVAIPDLGYEIVGAGVSTCAPTTPPS